MGSDYRIGVDKKTANQYGMCKGEDIEELKLFHSKKNGRTYVDYREYIESEEWSGIRLARLKRDHFRCQMCGTAMNLVVHHITYDRLGHENINDLITLCHNSHEKIHSVDIVRKTANQEEKYKEPEKKAQKPLTKKQKAKLKKMQSPQYIAAQKKKKAEKAAKKEAEKREKLRQEIFGAK